jgi:hypothetical protein
MEKEGAASATGIKHTLVQRISDNLGHCRFRKPVRRVILAERMPLLSIDNRLIEKFEHVMFGTAPIEASDPPC